VPVIWEGVQEEPQQGYTIHVYPRSSNTSQPQSSELEPESTDSASETSEDPPALSDEP
jgi:hypothetical protein